MHHKIECFKAEWSVSEKSKTISPESMCLWTPKKQRWTTNCTELKFKRTQSRAAVARLSRFSCEVECVCVCVSVLQSTNLVRLFGDHQRIELYACIGKKREKKIAVMQPCLQLITPNSCWKLHRLARCASDVPKNRFVHFTYTIEFNTAQRVHCESGTQSWRKWHLFFSFRGWFFFCSQFSKWSKTKRYETDANVSRIWDGCHLKPDFSLCLSLSAFFSGGLF